MDWDKLFRREKKNASRKKQREKKNAWRWPTGVPANSHGKYPLLRLIERQKVMKERGLKGKVGRKLANPFLIPFVCQEDFFIIN